MRRPTFARILPVITVLVAATASCGDGVFLPRTVPGYYQLVAVNGRPMPYVSPPSLGIPWQIWRGDLVLRTNGTFMHGVGASVGPLLTGDGSYRLSGGELAFRWRGASPDADDIIGNVSGDSISIVYAGLSSEPLNFTFRRARVSPSSIPSPRYRLTSVDGRTGDPLVEYDTTIGDTRYVAHVMFDSLEFSDGVFVRRHRSESAVAYRDGSPALINAQEWTTWGAVESGPGWARLLYYSTPAPPARDSLTITADALVRRRALITGLREERYTSP